jgi:hypothetical protein
MILHTYIDWYFSLTHIASASDLYIVLFVVFQRRGKLRSSSHSLIKISGLTNASPMKEGKTHWGRTISDGETSFLSIRKSLIYQVI